MKSSSVSPGVQASSAPLPITNAGTVTLGAHHLHWMLVAPLESQLRNGKSGPPMGYVDDFGVTRNTSAAVAHSGHCGSSHLGPPWCRAHKAVLTERFARALNACSRSSTQAEMLVARSLGSAILLNKRRIVRRLMGVLRVVEIELGVAMVGIGLIHY